MDEKTMKERWNDMLAGIISTKRLKELTGKKAYYRSIGRVYSKYTPAQLRDMHARGVRVKNPKVAQDIAVQHQAWLEKNRHRFATT